MHGLLGTGHVETLASKAGGIDICLRGDHDRIGRRNVFRRELIFCPNRSLRLNLDRVTKRLGGFLQGRRGLPLAPVWPPRAQPSPAPALEKPAPGAATITPNQLPPWYCESPRSSRSQRLAFPRSVPARSEYPWPESQH